MDVFAGGVRRSDERFMEMTATVDDILKDASSSPNLRHKSLQLAIVFMCSIGQLSPGAYFLRQDLFPSISTFIKSRDTGIYTFEALLFLGILANFHKSEAARLNPYLLRIKSFDDEECMIRMAWAANFAANSVIKAYRDISDDSEATLAIAFGSLLTSFRSDRTLFPKATESPRELFRSQPIEAVVVILPIFELLRLNSTFPVILALSISQGADQAANTLPLPLTLISLSSYLLTHASSISSPRATAYANLALNTLLSFAQNESIMGIFCQPFQGTIRLCRQRLPLLPSTTPPKAPVCALLDCCVLWLRHNLHKRLEVHSHITCIWICHRTIWFLQARQMRIEYDWAELWRAIIGLLAFLSNKVDSLITTGSVEKLARDTVLLLDFALYKADAFLSTPKAIHEFVYELIQTAGILKKQQSFLQAARSTSSRRASWQTDDAVKALNHLISVTDHYEQMVASAGPQSAKQAMRLVAKSIENDGLHIGPGELLQSEEPLKQTEDVYGFVRYACVDGLALMP
ncbi:hypothetical protein FIBSPDRAFT_1041539 [Athelia psychrophila]|uniref:Armadillo-like helical domain-containing protein n=1 Tax=Athelia psychrophila TaxID=1759441 RepID=A0A166NUL2_9AGAM|nr:hypothetical protein FIBSPDRAFT_1041539 [Fibularhizoctonia sp. CBS 109695]